MALTVTDVLADLDLMEASGTNVFFRYATSEGKSGKTDLMTPYAARVFIDVAGAVGTVFTSIWMGRAEQF